MIRPSSLSTAEKCGLAPHLAGEIPETSDAAEGGTTVHAEIAHALRTGANATTPGAIRAVAWLREVASGAKDVVVETRVQLEDPETGDLLTAGTPDAIVVFDDHVLVVDWKTGRRETVERAEDNLQCHAYGLGAALGLEAKAYRTAIVFCGEEWHVDESPVVPESAWWPLLARIQRAATRKPEAHPGLHCQTCYQRGVCPSWRERAKAGVVLLGETPLDAVLSDDTATALIVAVKSVEDACERAKELVKAHVRSGGRVEADGKVYEPGMVNGRRSPPSVADLDAAGLGHLVKQSPAYEMWRWRKAS